MVRLSIAPHHLLALLLIAVGLLFPQTRAATCGTLLLFPAVLLLFAITSLVDERLGRAVLIAGTVTASLLPIFSLIAR